MRCAKCGMADSDGGRHSLIQCLKEQLRVERGRKIAAQRGIDSERINAIRVQWDAYLVSLPGGPQERTAMIEINRLLKGGR